jgi:hypothetical protein
MPSPAGCGKRKSDELAAAATLMAAAATPTAREAGQLLSAMKGSGLGSAPGSKALGGYSSLVSPNGPGLSSGGLSSSGFSGGGSSERLQPAGSLVSLPTTSPPPAACAAAAAAKAAMATAAAGSSGGYSSSVSGPWGLSITNPDDFRGGAGGGVGNFEEPETPWEREVAAFALPVPRRRLRGRPPGSRRGRLVAGPKRALEPLTTTRVPLEILGCWLIL